MSDADRALIGKRHTPPASSIPVERDPEATPLPTEPPSPELVDGYEELSPPLRKILLDQHNILREHDVAIGRVWPARHVDVSLAELGAAVGSIGRDLDELKNVPSVLHSQAIWIKEIQRRTAGVHAATTALEGSIAKLNEQIAQLRLDRVTERHERELSEQRITNELAAVKARQVTADEIKAEHSERLKSLETDRTRVKAWAGLIGLLAGIIATIGGWLLSRLGK